MEVQPQPSASSMSSEHTNSNFFTKPAVNVSPLPYETQDLSNGNDSEGFQEKMQQHEARLPILAIDSNIETKYGVIPHGPFSYPLSALLPLYEIQAPVAYNSTSGFTCNGYPPAMNSMDFQGAGYQQHMEKSILSEGRISMLDYAYDWPSYLNATAAAYFQSQTLFGVQGIRQNGADCQKVEARSSKCGTGHLDGEHCSNLLENLNNSYAGFSREVCGERDVLIASSQPSRAKKCSNQVSSPVRTSSEKTSRKKLKLSQSNSSTNVWASETQSMTNKQPAISPENLKKPCKLKDLVRANKKNSLQCRGSESLQSQQRVVENRTLIPLIDALPRESIANYAQLALDYESGLKRVDSFGQDPKNRAIPPVAYYVQYETCHAEEKLSNGITCADTNSVHMGHDITESERSVRVSSKRSRGRGVKCGLRRKNESRDIHNGRRRSQGNCQDLKLHNPIHTLHSIKGSNLVSVSGQIEIIASQQLEAFSAELNLPKRRLDSPQFVVHMDRVFNATSHKSQGQQDLHEKASKPLAVPEIVVGECSQSGCLDLHNMLTVAASETSCLHSKNISQILKRSDDIKAEQIMLLPVQQTNQQATSIIDKESEEHPEKRVVSNTCSWHAETLQSTRECSTSRSPEICWAVATNHLPEKDGDSKEFKSLPAQSSEWAMERLKQTTLLMQNIIPPLPATMMQDNTVEGLLCGVYSLADLSICEACKMARGNNNADLSNCMKSEANGSSERMDGDQKSKVLEGFKGHSSLIQTKSVRERMNQLDKVLLRITNSSSILEILTGAQQLEKLSITNRLVKHHCQELFLDLNRIAVENDTCKKASMQKYVKAVRMPNQIPEGFEFLRL